MILLASSPGRLFIVKQEYFACLEVAANFKCCSYYQKSHFSSNSLPKQGDGGSTRGASKPTTAAWRRHLHHPLHGRTVCTAATFADSTESVRRIDHTRIFLNWLCRHILEGCQQDYALACINAQHPLSHSTTANLKF